MSDDFGLVPRKAPALLSIVVPIFNEEEVLPTLRARLVALADDFACPTEWILVDDGSSDRTLRGLIAWAEADPRAHVLELSRNFVHQAAVTAGLDHAAGDVVAVIDGDLQDPPELLREMLERYRQGWDVVLAKRRSREGESLFKRATASIFYRVMRTFVHDRLPSDVGDFRLMSRDAADALRHFREGHRFLRGMVAWMGFRQTELLFDRPARAAGVTKYPIRKMMRFAWDAMLSFSSLPLRIGLFIGAGVFALGLFMGVYSLVRKLLGHDLVPGWPTIIILQCTLGGGTLFTLGLIGEYVSRIYDELKQRPLYIVRRSFNTSQAPVVRRAVVATDHTKSVS